MGAKILEFVNMILPALWAMSGPAVVIAITGMANKLANLYIPRAIQIPLAAVISAFAAGLTGTPDNALVGLEAGAIAQGALSLNPQKFLASAKEPVA